MKKFLAILLAMAMVFSFAACGNKETGNKDPEPQKEPEKVVDPSYDEIIKRGYLVLGLDDSFPPMGYKDDNGDIIGFDIDLAKAVCDLMGVELKLQPIDWDAKQMELDTGNIDCIWNGMSWSQEREDNMSLSAPYLANKLVVVTKNNSGIKSVADLKGKTIAVQGGSTAEEWLDSDDGKATKDAAKSIASFDNFLEAFMDVDTNNSQAVIIDSVVADYVIKTKGYAMKSIATLTEEEYIIGFRKADIDLRDAVDEALVTLKSIGEVGKISTKWFGSDTTLIKSLNSTTTPEPSTDTPTTPSTPSTPSKPSNPTVDGVSTLSDLIVIAK